MRVAQTTEAGVETAYGQPVALLSVEDVARLLQVSVASIYQWHHRGQGPKPIKVGRYLRFHPAEIARWLDSLREET